MRVVNDLFERPSGEFVNVRTGLAHPKSLLRCEDHQRGLPLAVDLPAEQMEVLRSCRCIAQLDVVFGRQNKEAFNSPRSVLVPDLHNRAGGGARARSAGPICLQLRRDIDRSRSGRR